MLDGWKDQLTSALSLMTDGLVCYGMAKRGKSKFLYLFSWRKQGTQLMLPGVGSSGVNTVIEEFVEDICASKTMIKFGVGTVPSAPALAIQMSNS